MLRLKIYDMKKITKVILQLGVNQITNFIYLLVNSE